MTLQASGTLAIGDARIEYLMTGAPPDAAPTLVLLHEGLGCAAIWGDFQQRLADATGCGVFAYSRAGYGGSSPAARPRDLDFLHVEAVEVLPRVLDAIGFRRGLLVGHSDGASIAAIHAGGVRDDRVRGVALMAPHFILEEMSIPSITEARAAYESGDLKRKLARWHRDVDGAFYGWNDAWLDPRFIHWDITDLLANIRVPVLIIQGENDQYGTVRQIEIAQETCRGPVEAALLPGIGHSPYREAADQTLAALRGFVDRGLPERKPV